MRYCDLTLAYTATSGGIRTYIDQKRQYIYEHTDDEHILIIPGKKDTVTKNGRLTICTIASPLVPGAEPYRFFWRPDKVRHALRDTQPDVVELGTFFVCPWPAFRYREERTAAGQPTLVSGYFHTDIAEAYFGSPLRDALHDNLHDWSDTLENWGERLSHLIEPERKVQFGAQLREALAENLRQWNLNLDQWSDQLGDTVEDQVETYFGSIFDRCDLTFAATPKQAQRLADYGVTGTHIIRLGVDLKLFHPDKRSAAVRERFNATDNSVILIYGGRLDLEKQVHVLVDAYEALTPDNIILIMLGEGPLRPEIAERLDQHPRAFLLPYESDREKFATLLASADIYITAGPHETFGLSVVEAQACGLPVVGVNEGALTERVHEGIGRLGPTGDGVAMARNIESILPQLTDMKTAARRHVVEEGYGWDRSFEKLLRHYQAALRNGN